MVAMPTLYIPKVIPLKRKRIGMKYASLIKPNKNMHKICINEVNIIHFLLLKYWLIKGHITPEIIIPIAYAEFLLINISVF